MINLKANEEFKKLGCKWNGAKWVAPELAETEAKEIYRKYYEDLITIELDISYKLQGQDWGYSHARTVAGYIVATATGRDSGARVAEGVAVIEGSFSSGGSSKNYICTHTDKLKIRMKVSRGVLDILQQESQKGLYTYTVLEQPEAKTDFFLQNAKTITLQDMLDTFEEYRKTDHLCLFSGNPYKTYYEIFGMFIAQVLDIQASKTKEGLE